MCGSSFISILFLGLSVYFIYRLVNRGSFSLPNFKDLFNKEEYVDKDVKFNRERNTKQNEIDEILDKINKVGYNNLTEQEKRKLKNKKKPD